MINKNFFFKILDVFKGKNLHISQGYVHNGFQPQKEFILLFMKFFCLNIQIMWESEKVEAQITRLAYLK